MEIRNYLVPTSQSQYAHVGSAMQFRREDPGSIQVRLTQTYDLYINLFVKTRVYLFTFYGADL